MLTKRGHNKTDTKSQINRAITIPRNELLNKIKTSNTERLPLTVTSRCICCALGHLPPIPSKKKNLIPMYTYF